MDSTINPKEKHRDSSLSPMHTAEHILNQTMVRRYGCPRSRNTHIEKKKGKCDYILPAAPAEAEIRAIEEQVNRVIDRHLPVEACLLTRDQLPPGIDLSKLPESAGDTLRVVSVGDYDLCACIGEHVTNTAEIGRFVITTYTYENQILRIRFKIIPG